jgi:opacity protein-like surface antigen
MCGCLAPACAALLLGAPVPAEAADWTGAYAGISLGYAAGDDQADEINGPRTFITNFGGFNGSVHAGWQMQFQGLVAGIEVEGGYLDLDSDVTRTVTGGTITSGADLGAYATIMGRLGVIVESVWLVYGRAGIAIAELHGRTVQTCTGPDLCNGAQSTPVSSARTEDASLGLVLGAGLERQFGANWTGRIDYEFIDFRKELALPPVDGPGWNHEVDVHALKLGLSYRF